MRLALVYTTFPKRSETFLQREAKALVKLGVDVEFYSICGGKGSFEGKPVRRLGLIDFLNGGIQLLCFIVAKPSIRRLLWPSKKTSIANYFENLAGLLAGIVWADELAHFDWVQAQWGAAPAMVALVGQRMNGFKYSMGLHAYDLYESGGDGWLKDKVESACAVVSSNAHAQKEVLRRFPACHSQLIRRGLPNIPPHRVQVMNKIPLFVGVGRLLPKKGFDQFIDIMACLKKRGWNFEAKIFGDGPFLRPSLRGQIKRLGLSEQVSLPGWTPIDEVMKWLQKTDFFLFTGKIADNGDRDGFPNVIAEAFASGAVVIASDVAGVSEGVIDGKTGILMKSQCVEDWCDAIEKLREDPTRMDKLREGAYAWVNEEFDDTKNAIKMLAAIDKWRNS